MTASVKKLKKVKYLYERGYHNPALIAKKLGYKGSATTKGVEIVKDILDQLGYKPERPDPELDRFLKKIKI